MRKRIVITADDFGAALAVNEAVEQAHVEGVLTAASLMVAGEAMADAVHRARRLPALGVGLHVVLVGGRPILPRAQVSWLTTPEGRFHDSMLKTALLIALIPAARAQMQAEVAAQFAAFAATGLKLDHANAHKHFHLHPMIAAAIIKAGRPHNLKAIRSPRAPGTGLLAWWAGLLAGHWRRKGLTVNDTISGLAESGRFDTPAMQSALAHLPPGLHELYTHPATAPYPGSAPGYRYAEELAALTSPEVRTALRASGAIAGRFADFTRTT